MISTFLQLGGTGCLLAVLPVPAKATGRAFNRFVSGLAAVLILMGLGAALRGAPVAPTRLLWALAATCAAISAGLSHSGRLQPGRFVLQAAAAWAVIAASLDGWGLSGSMGGGGPLAAIRYVLDALSSAWMLGTVLVAMILGHYYLNIAGLAIEHLVRLTLMSLGACAIRAVVFSWGVASGGGAILLPLLDGAGASPDFLPAIVLLQRFLFGIAGGTALSLMAWRTARINSTQSATGILYIGLIAVLVGELASRYLLFSTGSPI
jgi:hypothetical protein